MAKQFITAREIEAYVSNGVTELAINDDVVVTDIGRERARDMGLRIFRSQDAPALTPPPRAETQKESSPGGNDQGAVSGSVHAQVKKAVIAALKAAGDTAPGNLDGIISRIIES